MAGSWQSRFTFEDILGESDSLRGAVDVARQAAEEGYPTLLVGETGTGKELFAHAIHAAGPRRDGPFVAINCGTLQDELAVAELCGHEPNAFTGADRRSRAGMFDAAGSGVLFLDELQDMPRVSQNALLRFAETGEFVRIGGTRPIHVDTSLIAAVNVPVDELERSGAVRQDLLYRINCITIEIPPLRERPEDVRPIAERCLREDLHFLGRVDESVYRALRSCPYPWPGNARGLRNVLLRAILSSSRDVLTADDLPDQIWQGPPPPAPSPSPHEPEEADPEPRRLGEEGKMERIDGVTLRAVLGASGNNVSEAARRLGVHRSTIYRRLQRQES